MSILKVGNISNVAGTNSETTDNLIDTPLGNQVIDAVHTTYATNTEYTATNSSIEVCFCGVNTGGNPELSIMTGANVGDSATIKKITTVVVSNTTGAVSCVIKKGFKWKAYTNGVTGYLISTTEL